MWALELGTLTWRPVSGVKSAPPTPQPQPPPEEGAALPPPPPSGLPPCAGHAVVAWGTQLLCLGGHSKARAWRRQLARLCHGQCCFCVSMLADAGDGVCDKGCIEAYAVFWEGSLIALHAA